MIKYDFTKLYMPPDRSVGIPERSDEWYIARRGRITASDRAFKLLHSRDTTLGVMMDEMAAELQDDSPPGDSFSNRATEHGHAFEEQAINEYGMWRLGFDPIHKSPGTFIHPEFDFASATPDFLEGDEVSGQVKCPYKIKNHLELLHFGVRKVNQKYYTQVQFEAFITGRPKIVFLSYHPDAPTSNQLHVEEIDVDEGMHERFREKLEWVHHMLVNDERPSQADPLAALDDIPDLF